MKRTTKTKQFHPGILISILVLLALMGCEEATVREPAERTPDVVPTADVAYAKRWWNVLEAEQRVKALYGTEATEQQEQAAKKAYGALDSETKNKVNMAARAIYGAGTYGSVGEWWQTLDCRNRRIAVGDGNTSDSTSRYCADYPEAAS